MDGGVETRVYGVDAQTPGATCFYKKFQRIVDCGARYGGMFRQEGVVNIGHCRMGFIAHELSHDCDSLRRGLYACFDKNF